MEPHPMEDRDIPALVKRLRSGMGLTQEKFAQELGVSFSTVNQWENGHRRPHPFLLKKLEELEAGLSSSVSRPSIGRNRK
jgi:putative transcriptional regulator